MVPVNPLIGLTVGFPLNEDPSGTRVEIRPEIEKSVTVIWTVAVVVVMPPVAVIVM